MTFAHAEIYELAQQLFKPVEWPCIMKSLENCLPLHTRAYYVNGSLAAFLIVNEEADGSAFISYCGVNPEHQGKGFGSKLLKETLAGIFQADFKACRLYVDEWNDGARRLYERFGFVRIGTVDTAGGPCGLFELLSPATGGGEN